MKGMLEPLPCGRVKRDSCSVAVMSRGFCSRGPAWQSFFRLTHLAQEGFLPGRSNREREREGEREREILEVSHGTQWGGACLPAKGALPGTHRNGHRTSQSRCPAGEPLPATSVDKSTGTGDVTRPPAQGPQLQAGWGWGRAGTWQEMKLRVEMINLDGAFFFSFCNGHTHGI